MEIIKFVLILALILGNVFCQDVDVDNWRENKWPNSDTIQNILIRLTRKPGPRQYLGLMGKKNSAKTQRARKRYKFQTFVGLMGKRSFEDEGALRASHRSDDY
ncbi:protachykinin [Betta splendens]|uniref:Protachykinin n=1 Tax=Betta splendens TaxID=158456 RepID=A0A6P7KSP5_BETSP|nr:protachykinin [Betta splendens]